MAFRGWLAVDGQEVANTSRLLAHLRPPVPTVDGQVLGMPCSCDITVPYDDSWPGLQDELGDAPYVLTDAPWYDASRPESAEFAGVWIMDITGLDTVRVQREVAESICVGGVAGRARDATGAVAFSALIVACSNAGARYGLNWLTCMLKAANAQGGVPIDFYRAHPGGSAADPAALRRTMFGVVLTESPSVIETSGRSNGHPHRQSSIFRVEWEMVPTNPYAFGPASMLAVDWDTITSESITWAHAPDCEDTASCDTLPTIYNAECIPPELVRVNPVIPTCGGCLPICEVERRVWEMPTTVAMCDSNVISVRVTNTGEDPLTVNMWWRPCGNDAVCDRTAALQIAGLQTGHTAVADSVTGRPYVIVDDEPHRQVGIVRTPSGAPWRPIVLDTLLCWELVAESAPGADYEVIIERRDRDA